MRRLAASLSLFLVFILVAFFYTACNSAPDLPFVFDGSAEGGGDDGAGDEGSGDESEGCAAVTCDEGEVCNPTTGECEATCETDFDCSTGEVCDPTTHMCIVPPPCESNADCQETELCDVETGDCFDKPEDYCEANGDCASLGANFVCQDNHCIMGELCPGVTCGAEEVLDTTSCTCISSENLCTIKFKANIKIYIDSQVSSNDLPNACNSNKETFDFHCDLDGSPENDPIINSADFLLDSVLFPEFSSYKKGECYRMSGATFNTCLNRTNVPVVPMKPIGEKPIIMKLTPPVNGKGKVFIQAKDFPQFQTYNCSPQLTGDLIIDAGNGETNTTQGGSPFLSTYVMTGDYEETPQGIKFTNIGMYMRAVAHAKSNPDDPAALCRRHNDPAPPWYFQDPNRLAFQSDPAQPGATPFELSTAFVPMHNLPPLNVTTETTSASGASAADIQSFFAQPKDIYEIRLVGERLRVRQDTGLATMRLVVGVDIPTSTRILVGLEGAALGAELVPSNECPYYGVPGYDDDGTYCLGPPPNTPTILYGNNQPFQSLQEACGIVEVEEDPITFTAEYSNNGTYQSITIVDGTGSFTAPIPEDAGYPYYKQIQDAASTNAAFEQPITIKLTNTSSGGAENSIVFDVTEPDSAFSLVHNPDGSGLVPNIPQTVDIKFAPVYNGPDASGNTPGCHAVLAEGEAEPGPAAPELIECTATLTFSQSPLIRFNITARAKKPKAKLNITELQMLNDGAENIFPPLASLLNPVSDGALPLNFGEVALGKWRVKVARISNIGVRNLTVSSIGVSSTSTVNGNPVAVFQKGQVKQGSASNWFTHPSLSSYAPVSPGGSADLFVYLIYFPYTLQVDPGTEEPFPQTGLLGVNTSVGAHTFGLLGTPNQDTTAIFEVYIEDKDSLLPTCLTDDSGLPLQKSGCVRLWDDPDDPNDSAPNQTKLALVYSLMADENPGGIQFSFRMDGREKKVVVRNARDGGDLLRIARDSTLVSEDLTTDFEFHWADEANPAPPANYDISSDGSLLKIGRVRYTQGLNNTNSNQAGTYGTYQLKQGALKWSAQSIKVVGGVDTVSADYDYTASLKGVKNVPHGNFKLVINRMMAGIELGLPGELKLVSSITEHQAEKNSHPSAVERFIAQANFNAVTGQVTLKPVFTGGGNGIRIFNPLASSPQNAYSYGFTCEENPSAQCAYFDVYMGDKNIATAPHPTAGRPAIYAGYIPGVSNIDNATMATLVLDPQDDSTAMQSILGSGGTAITKGLYDPVTGEVTFNKNLGIRLFTKNSPVMGNVDSTLFMSLSTECITDSLLVSNPSQSAVFTPRRKVPLEAGTFPFVSPPDTAPHFGPAGNANPMKHYVKGAQGFLGEAETVSNNCEPGVLYGRKMWMPGMPNTTKDMTGTNGFEDEVPGNAAFALSGPNFDISGLGTIQANTTNVNVNTVMYLTLKVCLSSAANPLSDDKCWKP